MRKSATQKTQTLHGLGHSERVSNGLSHNFKHLQPHQCRVQDRPRHVIFTGYLGADRNNATSCHGKSKVEFQATDMLSLPLCSAQSAKRCAHLALKGRLLICVFVTATCPMNGGATCNKVRNVGDPWWLFAAMTLLNTILTRQRINPLDV